MYHCIDQPVSPHRYVRIDTHTHIIIIIIIITTTTRPTHPLLVAAPLQCLHGGLTDSKVPVVLPEAVLQRKVLLMWRECESVCACVVTLRFVGGMDPPIDRSIDRLAISNVPWCVPLLAFLYLGAARGLDDLAHVRHGLAGGFGFGFAKDTPPGTWAGAVWQSLSLLIIQFDLRLQPPVGNRSYIGAGRQMTPTLLVVVVVCVVVSPHNSLRAGRVVFSCEKTARRDTHHHDAHVYDTHDPWCPSTAGAAALPNLESSLPAAMRRIPCGRWLIVRLALVVGEQTFGRGARRFF
jgi:hypothetical protein